MKKDMFTLWKEKNSPERIQELIDGFVNACHTNEEERIFRAGFYAGLHIDEISKEIGLDDIPD